MKGYVVVGEMFSILSLSFHPNTDESQLLCRLVLICMVLGWSVSCDIPGVKYVPIELLVPVLLTQR